MLRPSGPRLVTVEKRQRKLAGLPEYSSNRAVSGGRRACNGGEGLGEGCSLGFRLSRERSVRWTPPPIPAGHTFPAS